VYEDETVPTFRRSHLPASGKTFFARPLIEQTTTPWHREGRSAVALAIGSQTFPATGFVRVSWGGATPRGGPFAIVVPAQNDVVDRPPTSK